MKTSRLATTAVMIALSAILSMVKVMKMPMGGSVTLLSMLPVCIISLRYGVKWGFFAGVIYSLVQLFLDLGELMGWGLTPLVLAASFLLDYILAYSALGISGIFGAKNIKSICAGIGIAMVLRFIFHLVSGTVLFSSWAWEGWNPFAYSVCYNGLYMLPEMVFTMIGAVVIFKLPALKKILK